MRPIRVKQNNLLLAFSRQAPFAQPYSGLRQTSVMNKLRMMQELRMRLSLAMQCGISYRYGLSVLFAKNVIRVIGILRTETLKPSIFRQRCKSGVVISPTQRSQEILAKATFSCYSNKLEKNCKQHNIQIWEEEWKIMHYYAAITEGAPTQRLQCGTGYRNMLSSFIKSY